MLKDETLDEVSRRRLERKASLLSANMDEGDKHGVKEKAPSTRRQRGSVTGRGSVAGGSCDAAGPGTAGALAAALAGGCGGSGGGGRGLSGSGGGADDGAGVGLGASDDSSENGLAILRGVCKASEGDKGGSSSDPAFWQAPAPAPVPPGTAASREASRHERAFEAAGSDARRVSAFLTAIPGATFHVKGESSDSLQYV